MAEVTNELMYELLKKLHTEIGALRQGQSDIRTELGAVRWFRSIRISTTSMAFSPVMKTALTASSIAWS